MDAQSIERRFASHVGVEGMKYDAHTVERAVKIQRSLSTLGAVEYLKAHGVEGTVIYRVLTSGGRRDIGQD